MSRMRFLSGLSAALALGLAACSDFTFSGDPLDSTDATELAEVLVGEGFAGFSEVAAAPMGSAGATGEAGARITEKRSIAFTGNCEGGGTVVLAGSISVDLDSDTGVGTIGFDYTIAPAGCIVTTESRKTFTITGDPNLKVSGDFTGSQTGFDGELTYDGKFTWKESTREGACGVNVKVTFDFNLSGGTLTTGSASMSGEVCGVSITRDITVEA